MRWQTPPRFGPGLRFPIVKVDAGKTIFPSEYVLVVDVHVDVAVLVLVVVRVLAVDLAGKSFPPHPP